MEIRSIASATFDAQHRIPGFLPCANPHGHSWTVEVEVGGDLDPKSGWARGSEELPRFLDEWTESLHRQDLNDFLPGVVTSPLGIASAALDALALRFPRILTVRVLCSDGTRGEVRRTPRQV